MVLYKAFEVASPLGAQQTFALPDQGSVLEQPACRLSTRHQEEARSGSERNKP